MTAAKHHASKEAKPWDQDNPRESEGEPPKHLSPSQKAAAKRRANKAGRPYPNLVDNMYVSNTHPGSGRGG